MSRLRTFRSSIRVYGGGEDQKKGRCSWSDAYYEHFRTAPDQTPPQEWVHIPVISVTDGLGCDSPSYV